MDNKIILKALVAKLSLTLCAIAFSSSESWAATCVVPPLSAQAVDQFKSNPQAIVDPDADTRTIEALVRDLAGTDASLASDLVQLAKETNPRFQTAIAAGLAQAAVACSTVDQLAALQIQQAVAGFLNGEFQNAFAAVAGDLSTAATDAALSSANSSVGSVVVVNPTSGGTPKTNFGGGGTTAFFQITSGATPNILTTTQTTTTTAASPVSTTR